MPMRETYECDGCGHDMGDTYDECCYCCGDYWCSECYSDHVECDCGDCDDCCPEEDYGVRLPDTDGAVPGTVVTSVRAVGVEFESSGGDVSAVISRVSRLLSGHHSEHCGHEFVSQPMRGAALESGIAEITRAMHDAYFRDFDDCGTHFHVDMTGEDDAARARAVAALRIVEPYLYALTAGRESVSWCKASAGTYLDSVATMLGDGYALRDVWALQRDRYSAINTHSLSKHGTVEIRAMDGAAQQEDNGARLLHAIALATAVVDYACAATREDLRPYVGDASAFVDAVMQNGNLTRDVWAYIVDRHDGQDAARRERITREARRVALLADARAEYDRDMTILRDAWNAYEREVRRTAPERAALEAARVRAARLADEVRALEAAFRTVRDAYHGACDAMRDADYALGTAVEARIATDVQTFHAKRDAITRAYETATRAAQAMT